jgi:hypothetical protein
MNTANTAAKAKRGCGGIGRGLDLCAIVQSGLIMPLTSQFVQHKETRFFKKPGF